MSIVFVRAPGTILRLQPYEALGIPSPDECVGVVGLTVSLALLTVGVFVHLFVAATTWSFGLIVVGLLIGRVSFIYCGLWGNAASPTDDGTGRRGAPD